MKIRYCHECGVDYRIDIDKCQICGGPLSDHPPTEAELAGVVVWEPLSKIMLEIVGPELEEAGIKYSAVNLTPAGEYVGESVTDPQIQIRVPPDKVDKAKRIIDDILQRGESQGEQLEMPGVEEDEPDVRYCHECGVDYRIDIDRCQICGGLLKDRPPTETELQGVVVWEPVSKIAMQIIGPELEDSGIAYSAVDLTPAGDYVGESVTAPQIQIRVPPGKADAAKAIIDNVFQSNDLPLGDDREEPPVRYCHECGTDYRIDVDTCQICGGPLKDSPPTEMELQGVIAWEPVSKIVMNIIGAELEQAGIAYSAVDLTPAGDYAGESVTAPQIQIRVPPEHLETAKEIIKEATLEVELPEDQESD